MATSKKKTSTKKVVATKKGSTRSQKAAADVSAQMNLTDGIALIAELLAAQPHLREDLGEMAELVTGKLTKKETSASQAKASKPTSARVAKNAGASAKRMKTTTLKNTKLNTVKLNWKEVWYTNCPLISASNVDQELGWTREEFKKLGVEYAFMRSTRENDWYPHDIHNLDNLILSEANIPGWPEERMGELIRSSVQ